MLRLCLGRTGWSSIRWAKPIAMAVLTLVAAGCASGASSFIAAVTPPSMAPRSQSAPSPTNVAVVEGTCPSGGNCRLHGWQLPLVPPGPGRCHLAIPSLPGKSDPAGGSGSSRPGIRMGTSTTTHFLYSLRPMAS
jgi:hypothetical protein